MTPAAVIFDCDGVVVDSEEMTFDLLVEEFAAHGLPLTRAVIARDYIGGTMTDVARRARAAFVVHQRRDAGPSAQSARKTGS